MQILFVYSRHLQGIGELGKMNWNRATGKHHRTATSAPHAHIRGTDGAPPDALTQDAQPSDLTSQLRALGAEVAYSVQCLCTS